MRVIVFLVYLCFFLFGGGNSAIAGVHDNHMCYPVSMDIAKSHDTTFTNTDAGNTIVEDSDFDLEEDHLSVDDVKDGRPDKIFTGKPIPSKNCYQTRLPVFISNYSLKDLKTFPPVTGHHSPIYIIHRVLRL
jgi:hypothetical protein